MGRAADLPPGERLIVTLEGRSTGVFNVNGTFHALRNQCPHQQAPLCRGALKGLLTADDPDHVRLTRHGEILRCPWHGWEFDLRTGQSWFDPARVLVRRYDVSVEPGARLLAEPDAPPGMEGLQPGPYVAETFPVSVEQRYVLVEIG